MAERTLYRRLKKGSFGLCLAVYALAYAPALAQIYTKQNTDNADETTLRGCPRAGWDTLYFAASDGEIYRLIGDTSILKGYEDTEILLQGTVDDSSTPRPSFRVTKISKVYDKPKPSLSAAFSDYSHWHSDVHVTYGVKFSYPESFSTFPPDAWQRPANFAPPDGAITLATFQIPGELYPHTNFVGGLYGIRASTVITSAESCNEFGFSEPDNRSQLAVGSVKYAESRSVDGGLGTGEIDYAFHTFQNGLCYEVWFEMTESWAGPGCGIAQLDDGDELNLIEPLLARVSFVRPAVKIAGAYPETLPEVISFKASAQVADGRTNDRSIIFSWTTEGTDYVELSYHCSRVGPGVLILEANAEAGCENASDRSRTPMVVNRSPDSSLKVHFINSVGYGDADDVPMSIVVTVTPFSRGKAYPNSRRSITIEVEPENPFRLNYGKIEITFPLNADGTSHYQQGSTLTLEWTDAITEDECVELYLVRNEDNDGKVFHARIAGGCLKPSNNGSYAWTIPDKYSGYGYRIFARAPVSSSSGVSVPFTIVRKDPQTSRD